MIPFVIFASLKTGAVLTGDSTPVFIREFSVEEIKNNLSVYLIGSFSLALIASVVTGLLSFLILTVLTKRKIKDA